MAKVRAEEARLVQVMALEILVAILEAAVEAVRAIQVVQAAQAELKPQTPELILK